MAIETHRYCVAGAGVYAGFPICRIEGIDGRVPVIKQTVVQRGIRDRIVVVPESLLSRICVASICRRNKVCSRARRGGGPQVVPHPALVPNLYRGIDIALMVCDGGNAAVETKMGNGGIHNQSQTIDDSLQTVNLVLQRPVAGS